MVTIRPIAGRAPECDATEGLIRTIEAELAARYGGNAVLNRLEAEAQVARLLREAHLATQAPEPIAPRGASPQANNEETIP